MIIDTHCHLDDACYFDDFEKVLQDAQEARVERFIIPAAHPATLQRALELSQRYDSIYFSVGVHPYDANLYDRAFVEEFVTHPKCVAVGECGLDYYRLPEDKSAIESYKALQKEVFVDHINLAKKYQKPLIVHIREASQDSMALLLEHEAGEVGGVLHCYNADAMLLPLAQHNFYFGIGGVITFKNARKLIEVYPHIPPHKLLIETDAPYLTPHPHRGKRNEPSYCRIIAQKMADLSHIGLEEMETLTTQNAYRLFNLSAIDTLDA
ncbi:MAG: hydrolase TatD [Sulfurovum sp. FS08-3]|nr:MAG: hydrolase TatD [Sulfurovum sp. FS08-3]